MSEKPTACIFRAEGGSISLRNVGIELQESFKISIYKNIEQFSNSKSGRAMIQVVSHRPLTAEAPG
jgi:hypothetical protein